MISRSKKTLSTIVTRLAPSFSSGKAKNSGNNDQNDSNLPEGEPKWMKFFSDQSNIEYDIDRSLLTPTSNPNLIRRLIDL